MLRLINTKASFLRPKSEENSLLLCLENSGTLSTYKNTTPYRITIQLPHRC